MVYAGQTEDVSNSAAQPKIAVHPPPRFMFLTSRHTVDLVLDEKVDQRNQRAKETTCKIFPVLDRLGVRRAQGDAPRRPWDREYEV